VSVWIAPTRRSVTVTGCFVTTERDGYNTWFASFATKE
jgi:hypothetical protein